MRSAAELVRSAAFFFLCACANSPEMPVPDASVPGCSGGTTMCGGKCADTQLDPMNCGACGSACPMRQYCVGGKCTDQCPFTQCGSSCVDIDVDTDNCGHCGTKCPTGNGVASCAAGSCKLACAGGFFDCNNNIYDGCESNIAADDKNCGVCGHDCLGGACVSGACQPVVIAPMEPGAHAIALDANNVVWATSDSIRIMAKIAGTPVTLATVASPQQIAFDGTTVYWTTGAGQIESCAAAGCNGTPLVVAANESSPTSLAVDATRAYWVAAGAVRSCALNGCTPSTMASKPAYALAINQTNVLFTAQAQVLACAIGGCGGNPSLLAPSSKPATAFAIDGTNAFWATTAGQIDRCALLGCSGMPTELVNTGGQIGAVAVDSSDVYFTSPQNGTIAKCPQKGCVNPFVPVAVASGQWSPQGIAVDGAAIYWANSINPGSVMKLAK